MPIAPSTPDELLRLLSEASAGLLYPSESDEPFEAFVWQATESDALRQLAALGKPIVPLREQSAEEFFQELIAGDDGPRYAQLRALLESRLAGLRVLRIGEIEVAVYLIGRASFGDWAGLRT